MYAGWGNPIIITDVIPYAEKKYTVDSFFEYYQSHSNELDQDTCEVSYPDNSVQTIGDYWKLLGKLGPEAPSIWWLVLTRIEYTNLKKEKNVCCNQFQKA